MGCEDIIHVFFHMSTSLKLYHWQTKSYARHVASCGLLGVVLPLIDRFIETYMGRYKRPSFPQGLEISLKELTEESVIESLESYVRFLKSELPKYVKSSDTDLLNIRDEMLAEFNKTLYLFTLG